MIDVQPIPFNQPCMVGRELDYIAESVRSGHLSGDGPYTLRCARFLEEQFQIGKVLLTPSCTAALEMAAMLCDLQPGDEVILPSYTFVSTASAVVRMGAKPVFIDIRPDTLNLDETLIEEAITPRTKAIFVVHYAGVGCEMERIMDIARGYKLWVVEDAAQGVNAFYHGRALGSIGHLGCYSFHETKNLHCGEGGALCINDPNLLERAEILRDKGTNRRQFFRGQVDKYTWVDLGSSYVPSEVCGAFLWAQLEAMQQITARRQELWSQYYTALHETAVLHHWTTPVIPSDCQPSAHMAWLMVNSLAEREALLEHLKSQRVGAVFHYVPLHSSPFGQTHGYCGTELPVTDCVSERLIRLPLFYALSNEAQARVCESLIQFAEQQSKVVTGRAVASSITSTPTHPLET